MTRVKSALGILVSLFIAVLILMAGSQGSDLFGGYSLFALCGAIGFALHWAVFVPSYAFKTEHYFDLTGSLSYIVTVTAAVFLNPSLDLRDLIICAMITVWALRLGSFLFWRIKKDGQDKRFIVMKTKFTWFLMTWTIGGLWVLVTMAAGLAALTSSTTAELGMISYLGIALWLFGFVVEVTADNQKTAFRANPDNRDRFITTGVWSWSQHPNYFGEITLWSGLALVALPVLSGWQLATLISPVFVYFLLTRVSGIPLLDRLAKQKWGSDSDYLSYTKATSKLLLLPPKNVVIPAD
jgi:steroid 5-alpha reductase family enzyme